MTDLATIESSTLAEPSDETLVNLWLHGRSPHTQRAYRGDVERLRSFTDTPLASITLLQLQSFADQLAGADASKTRTLHAIKSLFAFGHQLGYLPFDTGRALRVKSKPQAVKPQRILSEPQVHKLISAEENPRYKTMLKLLYVTGIRVSELTALRWADCTEREDGGQITVLGKGNKHRSIRIPGSVWNELILLKTDEEKPFPFNPSHVFRTVRNAAVKAGITLGVSPHWLRHANCSHSLARGCPISVVQATAGHSNVAVTSRYLHAMPGESSGMWLNI